MHDTQCCYSTIAKPIGSRFFLPASFQVLTTSISSLQIPPESLGQIVLAIGLLEVFAHKGKLTPVDMFEDGRQPGNFGFDPLGFGKNPADFKVLQVVARTLGESLGSIDERTAVGNHHARGIVVREQYADSGIGCGCSCSWHIWCHHAGPPARLHADSVLALSLPYSYRRARAHHLAAQSLFLAHLSVDVSVLWQLKEIKNARLAMLAFGGIFHQQLLTKTGALAYLAGSK